MHFSPKWRFRFSLRLDWIDVLLQHEYKRTYTTNTYKPDDFKDRKSCNNNIKKAALAKIKKQKRELTENEDYTNEKSKTKTLWTKTQGKNTVRTDDFFTRFTTHKIMDDAVFLFSFFIVCIWEESKDKTIAMEIAQNIIKFQLPVEN